MKNSILTEYDEEFVMEKLSQESYEDGEEHMVKLVQVLLSEKKKEELSRAIVDKEYREELYRKYNL